MPNESAETLPMGIEQVIVEPLGPNTVWEKALAGIDTVIHLAARVHIMEDTATDPLTEFRTVNTEGTKRLASEAARCGVKRLVFISSIKVNGEESPEAYSECSPTEPTDPYGISKLEAELALRQIEAETGLEVVIIRPTLVYGPGVKANFLNMIKVIDSGLPLPFASIRNKRSLIYVGNFVDTIALCSMHPLAAGETFLVSDDQDISTPNLILKTALAMGVRTLLLPVPLGFLGIITRLSGKTAVFKRLSGSLTVDCSKIKCTLGWKPLFTLEQGLCETIKWYNEDKGI